MRANFVLKMPFTFGLQCNGHSGKKWGILGSSLPGNVGVGGKFWNFGGKLCLFVHKNL